MNGFPKLNLPEINLGLNTVYKNHINPDTEPIEGNINLNKSVDELNAEILRARNETKQTLMELAKCLSLNRNLLMEINNLKTEIEICNLRMKTSEQDKKRLNEKMSIIQSQNNSLKKENIAIRAQCKCNIIPSLINSENMNKEIDELKQEMNSLKNKNKTLESKAEKYRFSAISLKHLAVNLPSARINKIEWIKDFKFGHLTMRSSKVHQYKLLIESQTKYSKLNEIGNDYHYLIECNPSNSDCKYEENELNDIFNFVSLNHVGNINPNIKYKNKLNKYKSLNDILGIRVVTNCGEISVLLGQKETFTKMDIDCGVILGQYVGNEMLSKEYDDIYNGTKEEMKHLTFLHGENVKLPNGKQITINIDGIGAGTTSPLLYINDGRKDMEMIPTTRDKQKRINCEYVSVLCNGYPLILVRTTKKIKKNESLWIDYGANYKAVIEIKSQIEDQKNKTKVAVNQILTNIGNELNEDIPIRLEDDGNDDNHNNHNKHINRKRSLLSLNDNETDDIDFECDDDTNNVDFESCHKKRRFI